MFQFLSIPDNITLLYGLCNRFTAKNPRSVFPQNGDRNFYAFRRLLTGQEPEQEPGQEPGQEPEQEPEQEPGQEPGSAV